MQRDTIYVREPYERHCLCLECKSDHEEKNMTSCLMYRRQSKATKDLFYIVLSNLLKHIVCRHCCCLGIRERKGSVKFLKERVYSVRRVVCVRRTLDHEAAKNKVINDSMNI